jgi:copper transport protein
VTGRARLAALVIVALAVAFTAAARADAHALLSSADPAPGSVLTRSPSQVVITFTEPPDPRVSSIKVLDTSGQTRAGADGKPEPVPGQPTALRIATPNLPNGVYTVSWRTLSKADGHLAAGAYSFGIGVSPANAPAPKAAIASSPRPSPLAVVARWAYLLGLVGLLGLAFTALTLLCATPPPGRLRRALVTAWLLAAVGTLGITETQRAAAHIPLGRVLSSSLGHGLLWRGAPLVAAGAVFLVVLRAPERRRRPATAVLMATAFAAMVGDTATGHAAASRQWEWFRVGTQAAHVAAVGVWVGGLVGLLLCLGPLGDRRWDAARRYSLAAGIALLVVAVTGTLRTIDEVGSWHQLLTTGYGQLLVFKIAALVVLAGLGAVNRFRNVRSGVLRARSLRVVGGSEVALMVVVLAATALLQNLAPARSSAAAAANRPALRPLVVDAQDFATTVRLHLVVTPGTAGFDQFHLDVLDFDTRKPVVAEKVSIGFHYPDRTDVGDSSLDLAPVPTGGYAGQGANLSIQGRWHLTVLVQRGTQSTDVPMDLLTQSPPQPTDVQKNAGLPTIYTVHLAGGRQVQVYLDPGRPGLNELHGTFLDPGGTETSLATFAASEALEPNGSASVLTARKLDNLGHYVADATAGRGTYRFTMVATTTAGDALGVTLDIAVK